MSDPQQIQNPCPANRLQSVDNGNRLVPIDSKFYCSSFSDEQSCNQGLASLIPGSDLYKICQWDGQVCSSNRDAESTCKIQQPKKQ